MADVRVWCNNHSQYLEIVSLLNRLGYTWADDVLLPNYDPFLDAAYTLDNFKCAICINRDDKSISVSLRDNDTISFESFMRNKFTKANLEDGMIVRNASDRYYMYLKKFDRLVSYYISFSMKEYNDDLTHAKYPTLDIVAAYVPSKLNSFDFDNEVCSSDIIWERPEPIMMTISEIEEKLGITNLKIVEG